MSASWIGGPVTRAWIASGVAGLHVAGLAALGLVQPTPDMVEGGQAPVINLTLEPSARFDSPTPAAAESSAAAQASAAGRPEPVRPPQLKLHQTPPTLQESIALAVRAPTDPTSTPVGPAIADVRNQGRQAVTGAAMGAATETATGTTGDRDSRASASQGGGGRVLGAAAAPTEDRYAAVVLAWIERHKRIPSGVRTGVVTVRFVLDRGGGVRDIRLMHTSGSRALDTAALDQIRNTQPFPRPEPGTSWRTREFTVNIDYRLTTQ